MIRSRASRSGAREHLSSGATSIGWSLARPPSLTPPILARRHPALPGSPPGDYYVQAFVNVYNEFHRSDGHVVWMHDDQWEGQRWNRSPGNLYSQPQRVTLDAAKGYSIALNCDQVIAPVEI